MPDAFFILLQNLPFGLLLSALLLEVFCVAKNNREVEPAVLWLLFCSICASGVVIAVTLGLFFWKGDTSRLHDGFWGGAVAGAASLAWMFKRQSRNRGFLTLRERFYTNDPAEPPRAGPGQFFWILGWRLFALIAFLAGLGSLLRINPGFSLSQSDGGAVADVPVSPAIPAQSGSSAGGVQPDPSGKPNGVDAAPPANASTPAPAAVPEAVVTPPAAAPDADPTKAELPPADASAEAAKLAAGPLPTDTGGPVVTPPPAPPAEPARPVSRNSAYFTKVRPIFAKACIKCHGAEKHKGDLSLHTPDAIRAGINGKPAIVPGNPEKSRVYQCIILPPDDPDFMPSKGQPLSMADKKSLYDWIKSGADLGDGVSIPGGIASAFVVDNIAAGLAEPYPALVEALLREHVIIHPLSRNKRVLEIDFSHSDRKYGDLKLAALAPIALNIYALDLSGTKVKDADLSNLAGMRNLSRLILSKTEITDAGLANLKTNAALEILNLYGTMVSDAGMEHLAALKSLKKVYLWKSKATEAGANALSAAVPGVVVSIGSQ